MAVCILKYLRTEMHSSPLPRMVNVVVILFSTHFLRVNLNFLFFAGTKECLLRIKTNRSKITRKLVSEKTFVLCVHSFWRRADS